MSELEELKQKYLEAQATGKVTLVASESFVVPLEDPNDPSADEWARLDAANAEGDAIEALVEEFSDEIRQDREERWAAPDIKARLRQFAIRVRQVPS